MYIWQLFFKITEGSQQKTNTRNCINNHSGNNVEEGISSGDSGGGGGVNDIGSGG